jgi:osmotically-inducible protein OsmY
MLKYIKLLFISFILLQLFGCPAAIIGGGAIGIDTAADRRTPGMIAEDTTIELKAFGAIQNIREEVSSSVISYNGHVLIVGQVQNQDIKTKIENKVKEITNVKSVYNELTIDPITSISSRAEDALITSNVKARLFKENKVSPFHVKVVTENKIVYLMGILNDKEAKEAEDIAKNTSKVAKVIKLFEYINK